MIQNDSFWFKKIQNCLNWFKTVQNDSNHFFFISQHPDVIESGVFGQPDDEVQELVTAAVVKVPGSKVTENDIIELVNDQVDDAKKLRGGVIFVKELPKSVTGKTQRRKLLQLYGKQ